MRDEAGRFDTMTWKSDRPISLPRLRAAIERLARAKGLFETIENIAAIRRRPGSACLSRNAHGGLASGKDRVHR